MKACIILIALITATISYADCYIFEGGIQEIYIGVQDPQEFSVDRFCITGEYTNQGDSGVLIFSFYQSNQEVISYYAKSKRDSKQNVIFTIIDGETERTEFQAKLTGDKLDKMTLGKNHLVQLKKDESVINGNLEKYTLNCTDSNISSTPYFNFRIEFSNSSGPALGEGTSLDLFAAFNDYYGTETPAVMVPVHACTKTKVRVLSVSNYSVLCERDSARASLELNIISNYGLATGVVLFPEGEENLGIPANSQINVVCGVK